jgi:MFS family permease
VLNGRLHLPRVQVLSLAYVHHSTTGFVLPALLPQIAPDLNLSDFQGASLTLGYTVLYALALVPVGAIADRYVHCPSASAPQPYRLRRGVPYPRVHGPLRPRASPRSPTGTYVRRAAPCPQAIAFCSLGASKAGLRSSAWV